MKQIIYFFLMFVGSFASMAQSLSVASFNELPNDLDARANFPKTDPQTGSKYAIVKVITTQTGFNFDLGSLAVGATDSHPQEGEIWVYVPDGTKKIKITHPQLGQLKTSTNDGYFWFPTPIKSATCYRLELVSGKITTVVEEVEQQTGWIIIKSEPDKADVYLTANGVESMVGTTPFQKSIAYGDYRFRLSKPLYHDEIGMAHVDQPRVEYNPTLSPAHGRIHITSQPSGAKVSIDGLRETYTTPCTTDVLASGNYRLRISKEKYTTAQQSVIVTDGNVAEASVNLTANFASVTVNTLSGADIYVNGSHVGTTSYSEGLTPGLYNVEVRKASHQSAHKQIEVEANKAQTVTLEPTPIYGKLNVMTTPMDAKVSIGGKDYGITPTTINNLLVGNYTVTLSKDGYARETVSVTIEEGKTAEINRTLSNGTKIDFDSDPSGATVHVDGRKVGETPVSVTLTYGQHEVTLTKGEVSVTDNVNVRFNGQTSYRYNLSGDQTVTVNGVSFKMVKVEGGTFTMGATSEQGSDAYDSEKPAHSVTLSSHYIGQTEVTQALWKAVMGSNPSNWKGDDLPVESVSWNDCQEFVSKLNRLTGKNFRLPTEAEWEYAARGGSKSRGYKYSGSNTLDSVAWYRDNSGSKTHPVGTKQANELGLYDMSGNVWEWCQDWYGDYSSSTQTNPTGLYNGSNRVLRGGSWIDFARGCRVSNRGNCSPSARNCFNGIRLVLP